MGAEGLVEEECAEISAQIASTCCIPDDTDGDVGGGTSSVGISTCPSKVMGIIFVFFVHLFVIL